MMKEKTEKMEKLLKKTNNEKMKSSIKKKLDIIGNDKTVEK